MQSELVSICVPAYNQELYIKEAIDSALNQSYPNIELIIVDDNSEDNTWKNICSYNDDRIKKYRNDNNIGMINNYRKVLELVNGKYFTFLCGDDILHNDSIKQQIILLQKNKKAAFSYGLVENIGDLEGVSKNYHKDKLLHGEYCELSLSLAQNLNYQVGTIVRKEILPKNPISNLLYFDWLLWLQLGLFNEVVSVNKVVGYYRRHQQATTLKVNKNIYKDDYNNLDKVLTNFSEIYEKKDLIYSAKKELIKRYFRLSLRNKGINSDIITYLINYFKILINYFKIKN